ncbi:MAG TPA: efflux RND transporter periplasmic adaptor subunit [Saprospiraceae bacterium]|nr:efflux RND transporter periplasmic adaptor subunit [Saprospiraceae bacterium]HMQ84623.1 efflux RND transporter periplasmic adaptor subunit [Saprospiraceae bacterium]
MRPYLVFLSMIMLVSCGNEQQEQGESVRPVKYAKVLKQTGQITHSFSGEVKAKDEVELSFKVSGTLSTLNVKFGERVSKGQLIASIDPTDYSIQSNQAVSQKEGSLANKQSAEANTKAAEAQLINARETYQRVAKLYENNSVALSEYQQAKAALDAAQAQYDAAVSQVKAAGTQITSADQQVQAANNQVGYTRLYAPINGVITDVKVDENEVVNAGAGIAILSSTNQLLVEVGIPESIINKLYVGQQAAVTLPSVSDEPLEAVIDELAYASGRATTYPVRLKLINTLDDIRPGMVAEVEFVIENKTVTPAKNLLITPIKAIASGTEGNYVYRLIPENKDGLYKAEKVRVKLGSIINQGYVIEEGLEEGDLVAVAGLNFLYDGKVVKLLK